MDAVVVGIGTALADDPQLTARPEGTPACPADQPRRVVFDSLARLPATSQLVAAAAEIPLTVVVSRAAARADTDVLETSGAQVLVATGENEPARVRSALDQLGSLGVASAAARGRGPTSPAPSSTPARSTSCASSSRPSCSAGAPPAIPSRAKASSASPTLSTRSPSTASGSARICSSPRACASGEVFTGLIADLGRVEALQRGADGATLRISTALAGELAAGDSIAVNGVCLTATGVHCGGPPPRAREGAGARGGGEDAGEGRAVAGEGHEDAREGREHDSQRRGPAAGEFAAQAMHETLQRSTLGTLEAGDAVNLELALRADGRLGGHIVQGHVDGVGRIAEIRQEGFARVLALDIDPALALYLVEKGSVTLDGVSLTVSALREEGLEVSLIPETLQRTTLGSAALGARVNVEVDILAKHVQRLLQARA